MLQLDLKCRLLQWMVLKKRFGGMPVNSFEPRKTVVYIHGGGFIFGDKVSGDPLAAENGYDIDFFAEILKRGYNVVSPNYALSPGCRFPVQLEQVDEMLEYLTENQDKYGLNMEQVFLGGGSAGADLAEIYAALCMNPAYAEKIGVYPSVRNEQIKGLLLDEATLSVKNFNKDMDAMLGCWLGMKRPSQNESAEAILDAAKWIKDSYFPAFINSSNTEVWFRDSAEELAAVLEQNGIEYEYFFRGMEYGKLEHGYMQNFSGNTCAKECLEHMLKFMERVI